MSKRMNKFSAGLTQVKESWWELIGGIEITPPTADGKFELLARRLQTEPRIVANELQAEVENLIDLACGFPLELEPRREALRLLEEISRDLDFRACFRLIDELGSQHGARLPDESYGKEIKKRLWKAHSDYAEKLGQLSVEFKVFSSEATSQGSRANLESIKRRFQRLAGNGSVGKAWLVHQFLKPGTGQYAINGDYSSTIFEYLEGFPPPNAVEYVGEESGDFREFPDGIPRAPFAKRIAQKRVVIGGMKFIESPSKDASEALGELPDALEHRIWPEREQHFFRGNLNDFIFWYFAVFELARQPANKSKLSAPRNIPLHPARKDLGWPASVQEAKDYHGSVDWFQRLDNFATASVLAVDVLLNWLDELEADPQLPAVVTGESKQPGTTLETHTATMKSVPALIVKEKSEPELVFRIDGDGYYLKFYDEAGHVSARGAKGFHDLYRLVQSPDVPVPMLEFDAGPGAKQVGGDSRSYQPVTDREGLNDMHSRVKEITAELENIDPTAPDSRLEHEELETEREKILKEIQRVKGWKGDFRNLNAGDLNRMKARISGRIKTARDRLLPQFPKLSDHFYLTISASESRSYLYSPGVQSMKWDTNHKQ